MKYRLRLNIKTKKIVDFVCNWAMIGYLSYGILSFLMIGVVGALNETSWGGLFIENFSFLAKVFFIIFINIKIIKFLIENTEVYEEKKEDLQDERIEIGIK